MRKQRGWRRGWGEQFEGEGGGVVLAGVFEGGGDEAFGGAEFFFGGRGRADEFLDVAFPEAVD